MKNFHVVCWLLWPTLVACNRAAEPPPAVKAESESTKELTKVVHKNPAAATAGTASEHETQRAPKAEGQPGRYTVPFAWEQSAEEPLAQTRMFLRDALADNQTYMEHGAKFFQAFADSQKPRATVITCSDSRVHSPAWDASPENDDFVISNHGNQLETAEGSVEYGVEHLNTPLLLIIGHTGCGAVKAAMGDISKQSKLVERELKTLNIPKPRGKSENESWTDGVLANVHNQVLSALKSYGKRVQQGQLTVIGAVYDFRNDLGQGVGKLSIINVNGNSEAERMDAFVHAVQGTAVGKKPGAAKPESATAILKALENMPGIVTTAYNDHEAHAKGAKATKSSAVSKSNKSITPEQTPSTPKAEHDEHH